MNTGLSGLSYEGAAPGPKAGVQVGMAGSRRGGVKVSPQGSQSVQKQKAVAPGGGSHRRVQYLHANFSRVLVWFLRCTQGTEAQGP